MSKRLLDSLTLSIEYWKKTALNEGVRYEHCPLCVTVDHMNDNAEDVDDCFGCPVRMYSGRSQCHGTPYYEWRKLSSVYFPTDVSDFDIVTESLNMLDFLQKAKVKYIETLSL